MLMAVFNRKPSDELVQVFKETLGGFSYEALKDAFRKAETELDRFPTPKVMREICCGCMPSRNWRYNFAKGKAKDAETGKEVPCLIDPENGDKLFRPQDCPEGREFLKKFREMAGR